MDLQTAVRICSGFRPVSGIDAYNDMLATKGEWITNRSDALLDDRAWVADTIVSLFTKKDDALIDAVIDWHGQTMQTVIMARCQLERVLAREAEAQAIDEYHEWRDA